MILVVLVSSEELIGNVYFSVFDFLASNCTVVLHDARFGQRCSCLFLPPKSIPLIVSISLQTQYMTADNINIGLGAILETFEMAYV